MPSLILRQDAAARLTTRSIAVLSCTHVATDDVVDTWQTEAARAAMLCAPLAGRTMVATVAKVAEDGPGAVERLLTDAVRRILTHLGERTPDSDPESGAARPLPPSTSLDEARARGARLQAERLRIKDQIQAGALVPAATVERTWVSRVLAARALLLSLPVALADRLHRAAVLGDTPAITKTLEDAVRDVERELEAR